MDDVHAVVGEQFVQGRIRVGHAQLGARVAARSDVEPRMPWTVDTQAPERLDVDRADEAASR